MKKWTRVLYQPSLPMGEDGRRVTGSKEHISLSKEAAKEGMVLLKNDNEVLPLKAGSKVALFGKGTFDYVKGGGGSGDVTVAYTRNLYEGLKLKKDKISIFEELCDYYKKDVEEQYAKGNVPGMTIEPKVPMELLKKAKNFTDTAIISICRFSGEGWDRKSVIDTENEVLWDFEREMTKKSSEIFKDGDFCLSKEEQEMVDIVKENFSKVVIILNVGGMVDSTWFYDDDLIDSVLLAFQGGIEGGLATAELLLGEGNPSGKLVDTFAKTLEDYPFSENFHDSRAYVDYTEDIYVGYRYFETINGKREKVNYPFGYGLSYTTFAIDTVKAQRTEQGVEITVQVTNTGKVDGKEVVQVYLEKPQGVLGNPKRVLVAFAKTRLLKAGEMQCIRLLCSDKMFASYDDTGKVKESAYILEAGEYKLYVGNSLWDAKDVVFSEVINETKVVLQLTKKIEPTALKERMLADGSFEKLTCKEGNNPDASVLGEHDKAGRDGWSPEIRRRESYQLWKGCLKEGEHNFIDVYEGKISLDDFMKQLSDEQLISLLGGQPNTGVANTFGYGNLPEFGVPSIMTADGPAGLRIEAHCGINTTAWPCSTMLACTWNEELVEQVGAAGGAEVKENNIAMWLTPAVNIHRSPLCGRNFEYYSEDPFVAGKMGAAMVRGIQSNRVGATVKHFALNNKETNRKDSDSRVSERAAREIYLKAFEIIVEEAKPWSIMTSYNIINGHRASECKDLIDGILRDEWGFDGVVTSDWWTFGEHYKECLAGNDVKMGCGHPDRMLEAMKLGAITREDMEKCAKRILELILKID